MNAHNQDQDGAGQEAEVAHVDLAFPIRGAPVPLDHGYALYGALSQQLPPLHGASWLAVHPLSGSPVGDDKLALEAHSQLRLRLPATKIGDIVPLAGALLDLRGTTLRLGVPRICPLVPAATLDARLVIIKLTAAPRRRHPELDRDTLDVSAFAERYRQQVRRQLSTLEIAGDFCLCGRRSMSVAGRSIVGFSVRVGGLSADESLRLQERGLGGKRLMGCGVFRPTRRRAPDAGAA